MIIYMGISGSGKGTQCELLAKGLGYVHLSMSDLIRSYADPAQLEKVRTGVLLNDADAIAILTAGLNAQPAPDKVILDGFPRTVRQAEWLVEKVKQGIYRLESILCLNLSLEKVRERLALRSRVDDTPEGIGSRFGWYNNNTVPAIEYLRASGVPIYEIDGSGTPEDVYAATIKQLHAAAGAG